ncbi:MAG: fluoride efflux transporter CrcB [Gammaproteobacteria bacterium]|nr:fluoride efflux transporter CrcB [Gammaproteobacteria bacterium]NNC98165.1 fluoride efflux transporter CrcB [Gammaproteobacteria bacterium]NNM13265.1 fluoride efflux transporter CrcB [Gammaproteobacteria bacterium]
MNHWLAIGAGGAVGAILRYAITKADLVQDMGSAYFPSGTLIVNVFGSFLLGLLIIVLSQKFAAPDWVRLFLFVGVLGSFTTFSTFSVETIELFELGKHSIALWNMLLNLFGSLLAAAAGLYLGKLVI